MTKLYQSGDRYYFWCPGCKEPHFYQTSGSPAWQFNGDLERPTFTPSLKIVHANEPAGDRICHLFLTDGNLQFCADCWHEYRSQTIPLPDWEREENAMHRTIRKSKEPQAQPPTEPQQQATGEEFPFFLEPAEHVADGLENRELVLAKDQPQYTPLAVLPAGDARGTVLSRWTFSENARKAVANGADLYLEVATWGHPFQPVVLFVTNKLGAQIIEDGFFAKPADLVAGIPVMSEKVKANVAAAGAALESTLKQAEEASGAPEEAHEPYHVKCIACGVWFNKNDPGCPNCGARTPIVVGG